MQKHHKTLGQRTKRPIAAQVEQDIAQHAVRRGPTVHRAYLAFATVALGAALLLSLAGCQTPTQPTYNGAMVPPPPTGAIGQPAPYGPVGAPQVSYAQTPMPGPASTWQGATPPPTGYPPPAAPDPAGGTRNPASSSGWINVELVAESTTSRNPCSHRTAADSPIERSRCTACRDATTAPYIQPGLRDTSANRLPATPGRTATTMDRTIPPRHPASTSTADNKWKLVALL
jgi:hypothetical protein